MSVVRWLYFQNPSDPPVFAATVVVASIFKLSGIVNVALFVLTRPNLLLIGTRSRENLSILSPLRSPDSGDERLVHYDSPLRVASLQSPRMIVDDGRTTLSGPFTPLSLDLPSPRISLNSETLAQILHENEPEKNGDEKRHTPVSSYRTPISSMEETWPFVAMPSYSKDEKGKGKAREWEYPPFTGTREFSRWNIATSPRKTVRTRSPRVRFSDAIVESGGDWVSPIRLQQLHPHSLRETSVYSSPSDNSSSQTFGLLPIPEDQSAIMTPFTLLIPQTPPLNIDRSRRHNLRESEREVRPLSNDTRGRVASGSRSLQSFIDVRVRSNFYHKNILITLYSLINMIYLLCAPLFARLFVSVEFIFRTLCCQIL